VSAGPGADRASAAAGAEAPRRAHDFLAPALFAMIAEVRAAQERVLGGGADPEAIHDFRVALRRLRTALRPARRVFGKRRLQEIAAELRRFAQATGALRDEEVLRETLGELPLAAGPAAALRLWLGRRARQERARRRAVAALLRAPDGPDGPSLGSALSHLERRIGRPRRGDLPLAELGRAAAQEAHAGVLALAGSGTADGAAMHALRIAFKRLRYTAELLAPALGEGAAAVAKASAKMQKRLGELHDVDEALVRVARARGLPDPVATALRRALLRARREVAARARRDLGEELGRIEGALIG
jgi:CHAD domain-containing protein